jgi:hypoxanthine phosphoribosyltransferase
MPSLQLLIPRSRIQGRVRALAARLSRDYRGLSPLYLAVLKGAYIFLADLTRHLEEPPEVDFVQLSTYGLRGTTGGRVRMRLRPRANLAGRHVIVVEDIIDSGRTLRHLLDYLDRQRPASLRICALLARQRVLGELPRPIDYLGLTVGDGWLVGYGLDRGEQYRTLPDIYLIEGD